MTIEQQEAATWVEERFLAWAEQDLREARLAGDPVRIARAEASVAWSTYVVDQSRKHCEVMRIL